MKNIFEKFHGDGSHCGLTDLYPEHTKALIRALKAGKPFTTGWWASKKEIASAKIDFEDDKLTVSVSVSDDFDTEGLATETITVTKEDRKAAAIDSPIMHQISDCIYRVWDAANGNQKENRTWLMYCVGQLQHGKRINWLDTYLVNIGFAENETPPGDNYHKWGWQYECKEMPRRVRKMLQAGMERLQKDRIEHNGWVAEMVD